MRTKSYHSSLFWFFVALAAWGQTGTAAAQAISAAAVYDSSHTVATAIDGVTTFPTPPAGFDPVAATDSQRASYGFPPRPGDGTDRHALARWEQAMRLARHHSQAITATTLYAGPAARANAGKPRPPKGSFSTDRTYNWSGIVSTLGDVTAWDAKKSFAEVFSFFNVPFAQQAFNVSGGGNICDNNVDYVLSWNGIDGYFNGTVLQGGVFGAAICGGVSYQGWFEWYPSYPMLRLFVVNAGDDIFLETYDTSATQGYVYLEDVTTQTYGTYAISPKGGQPPLIGNSAEYIVERPCCSPQHLYYPIANYIANFWSGGNYAYTFTGVAAKRAIYPGRQVATNVLVSMVTDDNSQVTSLPEPGSDSDFLMVNQGCSQIGGCAP